MGTKASSRRSRIVKWSIALGVIVALIVFLYWLLRQAAPPEAPSRAGIDELPIAVLAPEFTPPPVPPAEIRNGLVPDLLSVDRYPTLEAQRQVEVGQEFSVAFSLTEQPVTPDVTVPHGTVTPDGKLRLDLPDEGEAWTIDVVLFAEGFSFRGPDAAKIRLPRQGNSAPALFRLIADPITSTEEVRTLHVTLWHKGAYLARVAREIRVVAPAAASQAGNQRVSPGEQGEARAPPSEAIPLDLGLESPELTVFLLYGNAGHVADVLVDSPWLQPQRHRFQLPADTADWLRGYYSELSRKGRGVVVGPRIGGEASPQAPSAHTVAYAKGFGRTIYERLAPEPFKNAFWELKRRLGSGFRSIQILTDDPLIPWELMVPIRGGVEASFLGTDFRIARWHLAKDGGTLARPPQHLAMKELAVIAPRYLDRPLPQAETELDALKNMVGFQAVPGRYDAVSTLFGAAGLRSGIVHFAGHGTVRSVAPGVSEYAIQLEDQPLDLTTWRGLIHPARTGHPLFFFNACDIGQAQHVLNFVDGWAPAVLEAGASGYVGGLWPLSDGGAADFAVHFYQLVINALETGSVSVADALRETRGLFFEKGDPTFLAYVYYGDPNLYLTR